MKKTLVFAGSNSKTSINKTLAVYAANLLSNVELTIVDLNDFELPIFGVDLEAEKGCPENALKFNKLLEEHDAIVLSLAENNGSYSAVFKNLFDWLSRIDKGKMWRNKPMLLLSTSPGARGGKSVMAAAKSRFPYHDGNIVGSFSLPSFYENFKDNEIINKELKEALIQETLKFKRELVIE